MVLSLALSYGGRKDIVRAARSLAQKVKAGLLQAEDITEASLAKEMSTHELPAVDLLIRTGGESRISDFLLYESAYAELMFLPVMWPDFGEQQVKQAIACFSARERRYGLTSAQVVGCHGSTENALNLAEARATSVPVGYVANAE
jgi:undecaprenyl diphosphate synthase